MKLSATRGQDYSGMCCLPLENAISQLVMCIAALILDLYVGAKVK